MRIAIKPFDHFVPGRGLLKATHVNVTVGQYDLGGKIRGNYEVLSVTPSETGDTKVVPKEVQLASGRAELTEEQANAWGSDDMHFVRCIAINAGLTPA